MSIDRYDPIRILGEGSFGKVYLMRDKVKRNFVCVKIIKIKNIPKKERDATKMEVDLLRKLNHPNIVGYVDSFLSKNRESLCICMEYCDGGDLASQIKAARRNLFSESKVLHWFVQLALGLHYMHSNKVLHRDLKTQNVFMLGNGRLVLGDLGISKVLDGTMDMAQTCIGTPYYMSPEIFKNKPYSYKSDVWALGCVLYEMTTLNHAFDAQSINGLATKIVKGKYPPISPKYSKFLSELIQGMLQLNPQLRPDLDQILRKPFIKKHVVNFFSDIASRPSNSIGEGTMIFKAAVGGPMQSASVGNDSNIISLKQQLQSLGMTEDINSALAPKVSPQDDAQAIKLAKEQASALQREKEHKKMVEAALEKLRMERENRAKQMNANPTPQQIGNPTPQPRPSGYPVGGRQQQPRGPVQQLAPPAVPLNRNSRNPSLVSVNDQQPPPVRRGSPKGDNDSSNVSNNARRRDRRSFGDDNIAIERERERLAIIERERERLAIIEREKKAAEERKRQQDDARIRAEDRRREEVRIEAKAREDAARLREESEKKVKEEVSAKLKIEQVRVEQIRAQAEMAAKAKREALREKERQRQKEEIEQLRRDKIELDRRTTERERHRDDRRAQERVKIESNRKEQMEVVQEKLNEMNDKIQQIREENKKDSSEDLSARERVILRRQERQAKEDNDRLEALRNAENENRRIRQEALQHGRHSNYGEHPKIGLPSAVIPPTEEEVYQFDSGRSRNNSKHRGNMELPELADKLNDINKGAKGYSPPGAAADNYLNNPNNYQFQEMDSFSGSDEEKEIWEVKKNTDSKNVIEEEEDLVRREEELRAELNFATCRVEELKRTLQETKSFLGPRLPTRSKTPAVVKVEDRMKDYDDDHDDDDEFDDDFEDEFYESDREDIYEEPPVSSKYKSQGDLRLDTDEATIRITRPQDNAARAYANLQDLPSPSGRLSDRIERLRQRCTEALGKEVFRDAYSFLKRHEEESLGYENGRDLNDDDYEAKKVSRMRSILGEGKAHYMSLIEQLIFMEETHLG